jgi:hypothetical protein
MTRHREADRVGRWIDELLIKHKSWRQERRDHARRNEAGNNQDWLDAAADHDGRSRI